MARLRSHAHPRMKTAVYAFAMILASTKKANIQIRIRTASNSGDGQLSAEALLDTFRFPLLEIQNTHIPWSTCQISRDSLYSVFIAYQTCFSHKPL